MSRRHARRAPTATSLTAITLAFAVLATLAAGCGTDDDDAGSGDRASGTASPSATTAPSTTTAPAVPARTPGCDPDTGIAVDPTTAAAGTRGSHERVDLDVDGTARWYTRYVPSTGGAAPLPLVVDLHGYLSGSAGQAAISDLAATAEEQGFVLATPQGNGDLPYWNAVPHDELPDDIAFIEAVIDDVGAATCIDPRRVYVDGFSNGAFLASLVACQLSDRVAAVAAVSGLQVPEGCDPARPVPVLGIHGTADRFVSIDGGPNPALDDLSWNDDSRLAFDGLPFAPVTEAAAGWAARNGCTPDPAVTEVAPAVEHIAYEGCEAGTAVELYVVDGAGHTWPGSAFAAASAATLGPATDAIDANEVIWSFFADHPMP